MKKLFVSVPMRGRTAEAIKHSMAKMHKIAEAYEGRELELIDTYFTDELPNNINNSIWYLGKSLEKLAEADLFIGIEEAEHWHGCYVEKVVAERYGIESYIVPVSFVINKEEDCFYG